MTAERRRIRAGRAPASNHDLAARLAPAGDRAFAVRRVVVGQLLAFADVTRRNDPDRVANHPRIAIGLAGVIDVARDVAADSGVANIQAIQLEAPDVALLQVPCLAPQALAIGDFFTVIGDDALVFGDRLGREDAPALDLGTALLNQGASSLPVPHSSDIHVDEVQVGIEAHPANLEGLRGITKMWQRDARHTDVDRLTDHVQTVRRDARARAAALTQHGVGFRRSVAGNDVKRLIALQRRSELV